jgi:hypothetical protein
MSIEDLVMAGMGLRRNAEPRARPEPLRPHEQGNWPMGMARPDPRSPRYGAERDRFDHWRAYSSPLGGLSNSSWSYAPRVGDASLRPQYRRGR